jgi:hypothetical protein
MYSCRKAGEPGKASTDASFTIGQSRSFLNAVMHKAQVRLEDGESSIDFEWDKPQLGLCA